MWFPVRIPRERNEAEVILWLEWGVFLAFFNSEFTSRHLLPQ